MSTISTKSRIKRQKKDCRAASKVSETKTVARASDCLSAPGFWSSLGIRIVGAFLRLFDLTLVPLHHDEGVNGNFLVTLVREGKYYLRPAKLSRSNALLFLSNHSLDGPVFRRKAAATAYGLTTFNIRLVTAAFGIATIGWRSAAQTIGNNRRPVGGGLNRHFARRRLPVSLLHSRIAVCLFHLGHRRRSFKVLRHRPRLFTRSWRRSAAALMVATKETWVMNGPVLLIALVVTAIYF